MEEEEGSRLSMGMKMKWKELGQLGEEGKREVEEKMWVAEGRFAAVAGLEAELELELEMKTVVPKVVLKSGPAIVADMA